MKFVLILKPDEKPRMTNAELMTDDKWRISERLLPVFFFAAAWERRNFSRKNYRPPRPRGVKGGCSPQNNLKNFEATKRASSRSQQILS
ncbi:MAG TPA: hypothetical protein VFA51_03990 [Candidatus Udaeobacter sp.]|nr:hypothetical protein [Candidatus Udaeobacter sp.]